ncbi:hypothetical protein GIY23_09505 [Allosaccharopolyspora coralli]|uniref:Uncharacterized protein n=1 Tax=Allosaccharopolyspora coralli TaxID=2665642 RepID=A0A5Q3QG21_9PSEU|nr:DUF5947 family protein [Allosaccharopolyspora coralli]QGK72174.1 hypothetical protein GIY23_09505 [Allosaccharopolyspora coralli]
MCAEPLWSAHSHVANVESRSILCTCRPCYLLFTHPGSGGGKHRAVPERIRYASEFSAGERIWEATQIPVGTAFLFHSTVSGPAAFYPSPAGATESLLPVSVWEDAIAGSPLGVLEDDVEALLVTRHSGRFECFAVPITTCYELVGQVRLHWRGFDGGSEVWERIESFFADLRDRGERVGDDDG